MNVWSRNKIKGPKNDFAKNNRVNLVMAIVFLFGFATVAKLYALQIRDYDLYSSAAMRQQQMSSELEPERGTIYISDYRSGKDVGDLYPMATNKDFAFLHVVPKDITEPEMFAENFYEIFKKKSMEQEIEKLIQEQEKQKKKEELDYVASWPDEDRIPKEAEIIFKYDNLHLDKNYMELRQMRKEKEIELKKEEIINEYLSILTKENDPYEPIEKKLAEEDLLNLYAVFKKSKGESIDAKDLYTRGNRIFIEKDGEEVQVEIQGMGFTMVKYRYYPENTVGAHVLGFVRRTDLGKEGSYGLEGFFDKELAGQYGHIRSERSADKSIIILNDREYVKPINGQDIVLTIDRSVQFHVCEKFNQVASRYQIDGGSAIVMDPYTGAILAMCSWPLFDPNNYGQVENISVFNNPAVFDQYEPGSVFKPITMAASIDASDTLPESTYTDEGFLMIRGWPKPIRNSDYSTKGAHGEVNLNYALEFSLNTGAIFAMRQIGSEKFAEYVDNFGFGEKTGIELPGESAGNIRNLQTDRIQEIYSATASFGQGITVTPLQMINSFAVIANGGILMKPYIVKAIIHEDGTREETSPVEIRRVISERAAALTSGMLVNVVENGHALSAGVKGYYVGGKTGTAQVASASARGYGRTTIHTFAGFAPVDDPKYVMLVKLDNPKGVAYAAGSCAPLFGEISEFLLNYWQVPKERK